jgi:shikimate dehydrogenase
MGVLAEWFRPGQLAMDLVYYPAQTCFMETAAAGGARAVNGLGMLVHQARRQVELWTGELPPVEVLFEAAKEAIRANNSETR